MNFNDYQQKALETFLLKDSDTAFLYLGLGLGDEAGEVQGKLKKILRDQAGEITDYNRMELKKELGDVLWYLACLSDHLGIRLEDVAHSNIEKLASRKTRGVIGGSGDNR